MPIQQTREVILEPDWKLAYSLLRLALGINIAFHGISRLLTGPGLFADSLVGMFHNTVLPVGMVHLFGYLLPWLETAIGLLVFSGLCTRYALMAGAMLILILTFGSTLHQDWSAAGLQLNYSVVFSILLAFQKLDAYSLDRVWLSKSSLAA